MPGRSGKVAPNVPFPVEGQLMKTNFEWLLASDDPVTSYLTLDKLLNIVCSCFLIYRTESRPYLPNRAVGGITEIAMSHT